MATFPFSFSFFDFFFFLTQKAEQREEWTERFVTNGGLCRVVDLLMTSDLHVGDLKAQQAELLLLRLACRFLLEEDEPPRLRPESLMILQPQNLAHRLLEVVWVIADAPNNKLSRQEWNSSAQQLLTGMTQRGDTEDSPAIRKEEKKLQGLKKKEKSEAERELKTSIVSSSINLIVALAHHLPACLETALKQNKMMADWVIYTTVCCQNDAIRSTVTEGLYHIYEAVKQTELASLFYDEVFYFLLHDLKVLYTAFASTSVVFRHAVAPLHVREYFRLLGQLLACHPQPKVLLDFLVQLLKGHPVIESRLCPTPDGLAMGLLLLLAQLTKTCSPLEKEAIAVHHPKFEGLSSVISVIQEGTNKVEYEGGFLEHLLEHYLFDTATVSSHSLYSVPVCKSKESRQAALRLITELARGCPLNYLYLAKKTVLHNRFDRISQRRAWQWHYLPEAHERVSEFAGLENLGATCYMNSLMQNFFMTPFLRLHLFSLPSVLPTEKREEAGGKNEEKFGEEEGQEGGSGEEGNLLYQLQRLMVGLQETEQKAIDTRPFFTAYQTVDPSANSGVQMDADEFLNVFFDRLERQLKGTPMPNLLSQYYEGALCHRITSRECPHSTEREQKFFALSLEVKGKADILESLNLFIAEDVLDGENKYSCEKCQAKVAATMRCCVKRLPNTLIVHLKRFDFDVETFLRMKVNDRCAFPTSLDMTPFMDHVLHPRQKSTTTTPTEDAADAADSTKVDDDEVSITDNSDTDQMVEEEQQTMNCQYNLAGVVVHTGTAESGHYYSFIRDRFHSLGRTTLPPDDQLEGKWYQFNDSTIEPFDPAEMADHCFGGFDQFTQPDPNTHQPVTRYFPRPHSAYMLFYERVEDRVIPPVKPSLPQSPKDMESLLPPKIFKEIWGSNRSFLIDKCVFDERYARFIWDLAHLPSPSTTEPPPRAITVEGGEQQQKKQVNEAAGQTTLLLSNQQVCLQTLEMVCTYLFETYCFAKDKTLFHTFVKRVKAIFTFSSEATCWFLENLLTRSWAFRMLLKCICSDSRKEFASLLLHALHLARNDQKDHFDQELVTEPLSLDPMEIDLGGKIEQQEKRGLVVRVLRKLVGLLKEARFNWKYFNEYFSVFSSFAQFGRKERDWMRGSDLCVLFADFYLESVSPFYKSSSSSSTPSSDTSDATLLEETAQQAKEQQGKGDPKMNFSLLPPSNAILPYRSSDFKRKMGEIGRPPPVKHLLLTLSILLRECEREPSGVTSQVKLPISPFVYPPPPADQKSASTSGVSFGERERLVCESKEFFSFAILDQLEGCSIPELVLHLAWSDPSSSAFFAHVLTAGVLGADPTKMKEQAEPFLELLTRFLSLQDGLQPVRLSVCLQALIRGTSPLLLTNPSSGAVIIHYLNEVSTLIPACAQWLASSFSQWGSSWLMWRSAPVRQETAQLVLSLCGVGSDIQERKEYEDPRRLRDAGEGGAEGDDDDDDLFVKVEPEVQERRKEILSMLIEMISKVEPLLDPRLQSQYLAQYQQPQSQNRLFMYHQDTFLVGDFFRVLWMLVACGVEKESFLPHVENLMRLLLFSDQCRLDCDENKANLLRLLYVMMCRWDEVADQVASQEEFCQSIICLHIMAATSPAYLAYNNRSLSIFYSMMRDVVVRNEQFRDFLSTHRNVKFAMEQFFASQEYPAVSPALAELCLDLASSQKFRSMSLAVLLGNGGNPQALYPVGISVLKASLSTQNDLEDFCTRNGLGILSALFLQYQELPDCEEAIACTSLLAMICSYLRRFFIIFLFFFFLLLFVGRGSLFFWI